MSAKKKAPTETIDSTWKKYGTNPNNPTTYVSPDKLYPIAKKDGNYGIVRTRKRKALQVNTRMDYPETSWESFKEADTSSIPSILRAKWI